MGLSIFTAPKPTEDPSVRSAAKLDSLWANLFYRDRVSEDEDEQIMATLKRIPLFEQLTKRELAAVNRILYQRTYQAGELIVHQADPGLGMYILLRGTVAITSEPSGHQLAELHEGDFFGELALLDELPRSASAVARTPASVLGFFQPDFLGLLDRHPRLGIKIVLRLAKMVGRRLRAANEQIPT